MAKPGLLSYLREAVGIKSEGARIDLMQFQGTITQAGVLTQPAVGRVPSDMKFCMTGIRGYFQGHNALAAQLAAGYTDASGMHMITVRIREAGSNRDVFVAPIQLSNFCTSQGSAGVGLDFESIYPFESGTEINVAYTVDAAAWVAAVYASIPAANPKVFGVILVGDLIRTNGGR